MWKHCISQELNVSLPHGRQEPLNHWCNITTDAQVVQVVLVSPLEAWGSCAHNAQLPAIIPLACHWAAPAVMNYDVCSRPHFSNLHPINPEPKALLASCPNSYSSWLHSLSIPGVKQALIKGTQNENQESHEPSQPEYSALIFISQCKIITTACIYLNNVSQLSELSACTSYSC